MKPNLVQCQVRAICIGLLWAVPYLSALLYYAGPAYGTFLSGWAWLAVLLGFPVLIAFLVAVLTGPFDRLAIVALLIPATADFVTSTHQNWVWHSRHVGTLLGDSFAGDVLTLAATLLLAVVGIALKRLISNKRGLELSSREKRALARCLGWDVGVLAAIAVVLLGVDAEKIAGDHVPRVFAERREEILNSPTATEADKLQVIMKLYGYRGPGAADVLQQALKNSSAKVRMTAAALLMQRGDTRGLPELEEQLMQSSTLTIANPNQVIHEDWLGYGEGGPLSLTFDLGHFLGAVTDPVDEPILTRLATSADPQVSSQAAVALENIRLEKTPTP